MIRLSITTNFPQVRRELDALEAELRDKVLARTLNRVGEQGRTAMSREIRAEFNLSAAKVREKLFVRKASWRAGALRMEAELYSRDARGKRRAINLINFGARQTRQGLSVKIKRGGARKIIKSGFIGNAGRTAFVRVGSKRLPIKPLQTIDVPQMFNTKRVSARVVATIERAMPVVFEREARYALSRFNRA